MLRLIHWFVILHRLPFGWCPDPAFAYSRELITKIDVLMIE